MLYKGLLFLQTQTPLLQKSSKNGAGQKHAKQKIYHTVKIDRVVSSSTIVGATSLTIPNFFSSRRNKKGAPVDDDNLFQ